MSQPIVLPDDDHNRRLVANVHPPYWVNPEPAPRYNLVVIGAGAAGLVSSIGAAGLGAKVALVERDLLGGDCLNVGCVPSKALLRSARAAADVREAGDFGVVVPPGSRVDFGAVMERMRRLRAAISPNDSAERLRQAGVDVFLGQGRFSGRDTVEVGGKVLRFRRAIIATGARAARPAIPGLPEAGFHTNETIFTLTELPTRLGVVGAGPIGCELAQAFARFGSRVTLLANHDRVLPREDPDAAAIVQGSLYHDGVAVLTGAELRRVERCGPDQLLVVKTSAGERAVAVDAILVGAGRVPNVDGLGLEAAGVVFDTERGVHVDDRLRTSNSRIYAAGDVCSRFQFTHAADAMARLVLRNALFLGRARANALTIPWCTYTDPEVAHVGLYEHEAFAQGIAIDTYLQDYGDLDRAILDGEPEGFVKIHARKGSDRIVGATMVARHAGEMISEITLAMAHGLGLRALSGTIHPYPTQAEGIRKAGDGYYRSRLTPWVKRLFERWLQWTR